MSDIVDDILTLRPAHRPPDMSFSKLVYDDNQDISLIKNVLFIHSSVSQLQQDSNAQTFVIISLA